MEEQKPYTYCLNRNNDKRYNELLERVSSLTKENELLKEDFSMAVEDQLLPLQQQIKTLTEQVEKLKSFKDYVHKRLDEAGIPVDPESPHKAAGCRIGGRLDIVLTERKEMVEALRERVFSSIDEREFLQSLLSKFEP